MAQYGAGGPWFAPGEPGAYTNGVVLGTLVKAEVTPNFASGTSYGDDEVDDHIDEFVDADASFETNDMTEDTQETVFGSKTEDGELIDSALDEPPKGGLVFHETLRRNKKRCYRGNFFPVAQAKLGAQSAATKGGSIAFGTVPTSFKLYGEPLTGKWRHRKIFDTLEEVIAWKKEKLNMPDIVLSEATITGEAKVGQQLAAGAVYSDGGAHSATLSYQWKIASTKSGSYANITGATGATYTPTESDVGKFLKVQIKATGGATGSMISEATDAVAAAS